MDEFIKKVIRLHDKRNIKIKGSLGVFDAYRWLSRNKWLDIGRSITSHEFYYIIRNINKALTQELLNGNDVLLPYKMGRLEIRKYKTSVYFKDGKLHNTLHTDWKATMQLWSEDKECYNKRIFVKKDQDYQYKVYYNKAKACYPNKGYYTFIPNRFLVRKMAERVREGTLDAFEK